MAEDLSATLATYKVQLQQVEAALTNSPDNDELLKLKQDLLEVTLSVLEKLSQKSRYCISCDILCGTVFQGGSQHPS